MLGTGYGFRLRTKSVLSFRPSEKIFTKPYDFAQGKLRGVNIFSFGRNDKSQVFDSHENSNKDEVRGFNSTDEVGGSLILNLKFPINFYLFNFQFFKNQSIKN